MIDNKLKQKLLDTFKFTRSFLEQNGMRYVACGGTVLGAVRHKGFIPWDDDIDIYMPRADYERLMTMNAELNKLGYEVVSTANPGYYMPFGKISELNSTIWEFERLPFLLGAYIDIFPLDEFDEADDVITRRQYRSHYFFDKYINAVSSYPFSFFIKSLLHADIHQMGLFVLNRYRRSRAGKYLKAFIDFENTYKGGKGSKCVCVTQWEGRIFQTKWFSDTIELPFEDTTVTVPRDYDAYLKKLYGDYMQLPPVEKRVSHPHYFEDFTHRFTFAEIDELRKRTK